ncbi:hypothetical protein E4U42_007200 [Claviceps africana]|uniref:UFSP1/2/DUB catalytic domain-containing protein n=1 Tax=Claviceps africana TaxID=83212 RepID=A0A8K0J1M8_9HYPO|nr:hypothetical protein E4U42_007200 [Claviceps africana]
MINWASIFERRKRTVTKRKTCDISHATGESSTNAASASDTASLGVARGKGTDICDGNEQVQTVPPLGIQDFIERAWDMGFNSNGRLETGGIKGTRKFIGTPEAQALFKSFSIPCTVKAIRGAKVEKPYQELLNEIEAYFEQACGADVHTKIRSTDLPPIYLQYQGHSLTVVGFEKTKENKSCLYVFDPSVRNPQAIKKYSQSDRLEKDEPKIESIIRFYRRGEDYFRKHENFELLFLK